VFSLLTNM